MVHPGDKPHRRYNPLTGEWVLVSSHRTERPWSGEREEISPADLPTYDQDCYLCPGNRRAGGKTNPAYQNTLVFTNDFPALLPDCDEAGSDPSVALHRWQPVRGTSRVICYSPRHDLSLGQLDLPEIEAVINTWINQASELGDQYKWVQIFENKGAAMGASNPHPHGQIWAGDFLPTEMEKEDRRQREYFKQHKSHLLLDYIVDELKSGERLVVELDQWVAAVPFWAVWPFEVIILPRSPVGAITDLSPVQISGLARLLKGLLTKYDNLFSVPFPFSMGWHGAPNGSGANDHWTFHGHIYPPLLRSATVRKFMVGYEMLGEPQRDLTAEQAAARLRNLPENHNVRKSDYESY